VLENSTQEVVATHQKLQLQVKGTTENITAMQASSPLSSKALIS
jgi:hypothetical protein